MADEQRKVTINLRVDPEFTWGKGPVVGVKVRKNSVDPTVGPRNRLNLIEGDGMTVTVADDPGNDEVDITLDSAVAVRKNSGALVGTRPQINFIEGTGVTLTVADDSGDGEIDVTITAGGTFWDLTHHIFLVEQDGVTSTIKSLGKTIPIETGTAPTPVAQNDNDGHYINYGTTTVGGTAGWGGVTTDTQLRYEPTGYIIVKTDKASLGTRRYWVGLVSSSPASVDTPGASGFHVAAFRFSTSAGDTNWQAVTSDGASDTVTNTGVLVSLDTRYKLGITVTTTDVKFYIDDVLVATNTTTLPGSTTNMGIFARVTKISGSGQWDIYLTRAVFEMTL